MKKKLLLLLCFVLTCISSWAQTYISGQEVKAGGNLFLYNIGTGKFLTDGLDYGTRATTDNAGRVITLAASDENFTIYTSNYSNNAKAGFVGSFSNGVYVDAADGNKAACTFESVAVEGYTNAYTIKIGEKYLNNIPSTSVVDLEEAVNDNNSYWLIVPMSARQAQDDYTYYLLNTDMNHPWEREAWSGLTKNSTSTWITNGVGGEASNRNQEFYNMNFDMYQTLSNVPNGKWIMTCQGYYRGTDADSRNAMMYINSTTSPMLSIYADAKDEEDTGNGFVTVSFTEKKLPNSQSDASKALTAGSYSANKVSSVVTDGTLKVGFKKETLVNYDWTVIDNVKLFYIDITKLNDKIAEAEVIYNLLDDKSSEGAVALNTAITTAKAADVQSTTEMNSAVDALQAKIVAVKSTLYTKTDLADGKYIVSLGDKYFGAGNSWGTQASLLPHPEYVELTKLSDGKYNIKTQVSNGGESQYFNGSYMDGTATGIELIPVEGGYLMSAGSGLCYNNNGVVETSGTSVAWTFTPIADVDAKMNNATVANPVDVTYKIKDPNLGRNNVNHSSWTYDDNAWRTGANENKLFESWHKASFDMYQTISDLPNGFYEVKVTALHETSTKSPVMYANSKTVDLPMKGDLSSYADASGANANYAANAFAAGEYTISVKVQVTDGTLKIGVKSEDNSDDWCVWDNFQLYYLGAASVSRSTATGKYGTICLPYAATVTGATVYTAAMNSNNNGVTLTEVGTSLVAGTPYIYKASDDAQTFTYASGDLVEAPTNEGVLNGVFTATAVPVGSYVLQTKGETQQFYIVEAGAQPTLSAYKAYLTVPTSAGGEVKALAIGDDATAISHLTAQGSQLTDGKFIENGKIVIVKNGLKFNTAGMRIKN